GELVFVSGHPGKTDRLNTVAALKYARDTRLPFMLDMLRRLEIMLQQFSHDGPEQARIAKEDLFGVQNSRKALYGQIEGLEDPEIIAKKETAEKALRERIAREPKLKSAGADWEQIEQAVKIRRELLVPATVLESGRGFHSTLFSIARTLVRLAAENEKPNGERLREYSEAARASLELELYSEAPIYADFELA